MSAAEITDREANSHVETMVRQAGSSFYWGMRLLPPMKQSAMYAIYAFCRAVDDVADEPAPQTGKLAALDRWRHEVVAIFDNRPTTLIGRALVDPVRRFSLAQRDFNAILDGVETDARGPVTAPTMADLETYCARVAGAVGLLSVRVFECRHRLADTFALATGHALQLTNILRDIDEDAEVGRLYLPRELLLAANIDTTVPIEVRRHPNLGQACAALAAIAERRFDEADELRTAMPATAAATLRSAVIMTAMYRRILGRLSARGWNALEQPVRLGRAEKLWLAIRHGMLPT